MLFCYSLLMAECLYEHDNAHTNIESWLLEKDKMC